MAYRYDPGNPFQGGDMGQPGGPVYVDESSTEVSKNQPKKTPWLLDIAKHLPIVFGPGLGAYGLETLLTPGVAAGASAASSATSGIAPASAPVAAGAGAGAGAGSGASAGGTFASRLPKLLDQGGKALGAFASAQGQNRIIDNAQQQDYDAGERARTGLELNSLETDLDQRRYLNENYQRNIANALRGALLKGTQDVNVQAPAGIPMGSVTGGLRPSAISGKEDIGNAISQSAMDELLNPTQPGSGTSQATPFTPPAFAGNPQSEKDVTAQVLATGKALQSAGRYVDPSVLNDPGYWARQIIGKGGYINGGQDLNNIAFFTDFMQRVPGGGSSASSSKRLPSMPLIPKSSTPRGRSGSETATGIGSAVLPFVSQLLSGYRQAPEPASPTVIHSPGLMRNVRF